MATALLVVSPRALDLHQRHSCLKKRQSVQPQQLLGVMCLCGCLHVLSCRFQNSFVWTLGRIFGTLLGSFYLLIVWSLRQWDCWFGCLYLAQKAQKSGYGGSGVIGLAYVHKGAGVGAYWGSPLPCRELEMASFLLQGFLVSCQPQRLCSSGLEVVLKLGSGTNPHNDLEQDPGSLCT